MRQNTLNLARSLLGIALLFVAPSVLAQSLKCDEKQRECFSTLKRLTIGESVAIVNSDSEVVAYGDVVAIDGRERKIKITKRFGVIPQGASILRMDEEGNDEVKNLKTVKASTQIVAGGELGIATINIAGNTAAYMFSGFGQYRWQHGVHFVGRASFFTASGTVEEPFYEIYDETFSVNGLLVMGGASYYFFEKEAVNLRTEVDLGLAYVMMDTSAYRTPGPLKRIGNGLGYTARLGLDAMMTFGSLTPYVGLAFTQINAAQAPELHVGLLFPIK